MAGIGFALKKLSDKDSLASRSVAGGHAILISSGPWIVIIIGLFLLHAFISPIIGEREWTATNVLTVYAFAISLVVSGPIAIDLTLRVSSRLYARRFGAIRQIYAGALLVAVVSSAVIGAAILFGVVRVSGALGLAALICTVQVACLWIAMSMVAAIKQYVLVTTAFIVGLSCSLVFATAAASMGHGVPGVLLGFSLGLSLSFFVLHTLIMRTFPGKLAPMLPALAQLLRERPSSMTFASAAVFAGLAVWIDKLVVWSGPAAQSAGAGLLYEPRYDSPMFLAYLSIVPTMSVVAVWLETSFFDEYRHYRDILQSGGTLRHIDDQRRLLAGNTIDTVFSAFLVQLAISGFLALMAPYFVSFMGFPSEAVSVFRFALIGAAFHFLFQASCGIILFIQYGRAYLWLQLLFLLLNGALTAFFMSAPNQLGMGYLLSAVIAGTLAYGTMRKSLSRLNHLTFVTNNSAIAA